ncbi:RNA polymerase factor sigma-54 [Lentisphaerota bacterium WC36G]|nr:RNA polymerase factor sigma-54 [Lentisphaerae bacterium WC36]
MFEQNFTQSQSQKLTQEQILAPQQLLSLEVLLAPMMELQEKIEQELEANPVLEKEESNISEAVGDFLSHSVEQADNTAEDSKSDENAEIAELISLSDNWYDSLPIMARNSENDEKREHMFNSLIEEESLQDHLLGQLRFLDLNRKYQAIAEEIIGSIDEHGYLCIPLEDIATSGQFSLNEAEEVLKIVQTFEPLGVGARDLSECLLLQLQIKSEQLNIPEDKLPRLEVLIKNHLEDISRNKIPQVAKTMRISVDEIYFLLNDIKKLNPYPANGFASSNPIYMVAEFEIVEKEGEFQVISKEGYLPRIRISKHYENLLNSDETSAEDKKYIKEKILNGNMFMKSIEQRQNTITKIANALISTQEEFLREGVDKLKPLKMQTIADMVEVHETTVSRAIANKYIRTPQGVFPFKYFFSGGFQTETGEDVSSRGVKEQIKDLIDNENKKKPLSDSKIAKLLADEGVKVARRTVAKYREELGIGSSSLRKEF